MSGSSLKSANIYQNIHKIIHHIIALFCYFIKYLHIQIAYSCQSVVLPASFNTFYIPLNVLNPFHKKMLSEPASEIKEWVCTYINHKWLFTVHCCNIEEEYSNRIQKNKSPILYRLIFCFCRHFSKNVTLQMYTVAPSGRSSLSVNTYLCCSCYLVWMESVHVNVDSFNVVICIDFLLCIWCPIITWTVFSLSSCGNRIIRLPGHLAELVFGRLWLVLACSPEHHNSKQKSTKSSE